MIGCEGPALLAHTTASRNNLSDASSFFPSKSQHPPFICRARPASQEPPYIRFRTYRFQGDPRALRLARGLRGSPRGDLVKPWRLLRPSAFWETPGPPWRPWASKTALSFPWRLQMPERLRGCPSLGASHEAMWFPRRTYKPLRAS